MYCTTDDLLTLMSKKDLIVLSNQSQLSAQSINTTLVEQLIREKSEVIDGFVGSNYPLPLPTNPPLLRTICKELVYCELYRFGNYSDVQKSQVIESRDKKSMNLLQDIASGKIKLTFESEITVEKESALPRFSSSVKTFTVEFLKGF